MDGEIRYKVASPDHVCTAACLLESYNALMAEQLVRSCCDVRRDLKSQGPASAAPALLQARHTAEAFDPCSKLPTAFGSGQAQETFVLLLR